jgi:DHA1 family bicyclomycin/chloramphenicol resistance-like MFS transporter
VARYAAVLGLLTTIGPFAIDMYLPALPAIGRSLGADAHAMQASLMAFFIAVGAGQLVAGPLSDMFGRRRPMLAGLAVFVLASIGCAFAPSAGVLVALRFVQGLGACACMVTPRAVVRDLFTGAEAARMMSLLLMVYSVSPILAPLAGSLVAEAAGWRAVFAVVAVLGVGGAAGLLAFLPETRPAAERLRSNLRSAMAGYGVLLRDRHFMALALMASFTVSGFFVFVANSPFVMSAHFGVSPRPVCRAVRAQCGVAARAVPDQRLARGALRHTARAAHCGHGAGRHRRPAAGADARRRRPAPGAGAAADDRLRPQRSHRAGDLRARDGRARVARGHRVGADRHDELRGRRGDGGAGRAVRRRQAAADGRGHRLLRGGRARTGLASRFGRRIACSV